jgi:hypothetical protein
MKFLLSALMVLVGGTALLLWRANAGKPVPAIPFLTQRREAPKAAPPAPPAPQKAPKSGRVIRVTASNASLHSQAEPEPNQPEERAASATTVPVPVSVARLPPPAPNRIALGADTESVTGEYGDPSAWTITEVDGHMIETLVYAQEHGGSATLIRVVDGRVAGAYAKAAPVSPRGSSIRRLGLQN